MANPGMVCLRRAWIMAVCLWLTGCGADPGAGSILDLGGPADLREPPGDAALADRSGEVSPTDAGDTEPEGAPDTAECAAAKDCTAIRRAAPICTAWACVGGSCVLVAEPETAPCDDGNACTGRDRCLAGLCTGDPLSCPPAPEPCTGVECRPEVGCEPYPLTGALCDDGDPCTVQDACAGGLCTGLPAACDDGNPCTLDGCEPGSGECLHDPANGPCDDHDACTGGDECLAGTCTGDPVACGDEDPCTAESCEPATGCVVTLINGAPCDDGDACTANDHCVAGVCGGSSVPCDDGNPCTDDGCSPESGCRFLAGTGAACDDGNSCTETDACVAGVCLGQAAACGDGNPCTLDSCTVSGGCIHVEPPGLPCDDGSACTVDDACYQGACVPGDPPDCDDHDDCTEDSCDPGAGCQHQPLDGTPCSDGSACTDGDQCVAGACIGEAVDCDDVNPCTDDACDPAVGCVLLPNALPCDDDDPCTAGDVCAGGQCQAGWNPQCLAVHRIVLAGDSWSTGLILPLRDALDARGLEEVQVSWELTSKPGSTVAGWIESSSMMNALYLSLLMDPPAELLVFTLTGNDYLGATHGGLALSGGMGWFVGMTLIQWDLQTFVAMVRSVRPDLKILMVGYDYLHFDMITALGTSFPGLERMSFNLGLVDLAGRCRDVALATPDMVYGHNMGILQYTFGDYVHLPFLCPLPALGFPEYGPGQVPKPGPAPGYTPFPGGWFTYPSPLDHIPDGIHPDYAGYRAIIENSLDQVPLDWLVLP
ncbi:MAG: hypothetical protein FJ098_09520 [Deltaproteobacteria bacterium]|nr:hypothetical protein [Deltaproteobacteria bacterium]